MPNPADHINPVDSVSNPVDILTTAAFKRNEVNVKAPPFNAKSNDADDDFTTIQAALDYCYTNKLILVFPPGTYKITQKLLFRKGQFVSGHGHEASIIKQYGNCAVAGTADTNKHTGDIDIRDIQFLQTTDNNGLDIECSLKNKLKEVKVVGTFVRGTGDSTGTKGINIHGRADADWGAHYTCLDTCYIQSFVYGVKIQEKSNDILINDTAISFCHDSVRIDYDTTGISRPSRVLIMNNSLEKFDNSGVWSDSYGPNNVIGFNRMDTDAAPHGIYLGEHTREHVCLYNYYAGCTDKIIDLGFNFIVERVEDNEVRTLTPKATSHTIGTLEKQWLNGFFKKIYMPRTEIPPDVGIDEIGTIFIAKSYEDWNPAHDNGSFKGSAYPVMWDSGSRWKPLAKYRIEVWGEEAPDVAGSTKAYLNGDYCFNLIPAPGKPMGWSCITQGSPGVWRADGQVGYREIATTPVGNTVPYQIGEEILDVVGLIWYKAVGTTSADWRALNS